MGRSPKKIELISSGPIAHISDIKLIRTDTTLDLSQKAEKGIIIHTAPPPPPNSRPQQPQNPTSQSSRSSFFTPVTVSGSLESTLLPAKRESDDLQSPKPIGVLAEIHCVFFPERNGCMVFSASILLSTHIEHLNEPTEVKVITRNCHKFSRVLIVCNKDNFKAAKLLNVDYASLAEGADHGLDGGYRGIEAAGPTDGNIKLIRTDTTLDLSQKAEKGIIPCAAAAAAALFPATTPKPYLSVLKLFFTPETDSDTTWLQPQNHSFFKLFPSRLIQIKLFKVMEKTCAFQNITCNLNNATMDEGRLSYESLVT
ncbi:hypothetical protein DM860_005579 [Cuscuta australis]|uniref:Uncharacterized protein n=1 Tax=Cuscuta australis TaxID=267555 RepID=A0A328DR48_9ASTE|nr:hypothetical protein DM860_005579 [Cuscuta australis]